MKVVIATDGVFPNVMGGIARHSRGLVQHLARLDVDLTVVHPGPLAFSLPNVNEVLVGQRSRSFKGHYIWETYDLSRRIRDAVEGLGSFTGVGYAQGAAMWAYLRRRSFPVTLNPHGLEMFQQIGARESNRALPFRTIMKRQTRHADSVISLGGHLTGILRERCRVDPRRIVTIPNAVDPGYIEGLLPDTVRRPGSFLYVGRLFPNKGVVELIEAFNSAPPTASLTIVGDGPLAERLRRSARHPGIVFEGSVSDERLFWLIGSSEALVLPTLGEGMPTVILEAMTARLPIIATDVGAVSELVDVDNGFLIDPGDVAALRAAFDGFMSLAPERRRALGEASRVKVEERFTWDAVTATTLEHLEGLAAGGITS